MSFRTTVGMLNVLKSPHFVIMGCPIMKIGITAVGLSRAKMSQKWRTVWLSTSKNISFFIIDFLSKFHSMKKVLADKLASK